jgi:hypothetical protein
MALVGAVLGAVLGPVLILNQSRQVHEQLRQQQDFLNINASVRHIDHSPVTLDQLGLTTAAVGGVLDQLQQAESEIQQLEESFWIKLPLWALAGMCLGSFACGIVGGYHVVWLMAWSGSYFIYKFIRLIYRLYWLNGGDQPTTEEVQEDGTVNTVRQRNENRIMPLVIKFTILAVVVITILAFVLFYLTAIRVP